MKRKILISLFLLLVFTISRIFSGNALLKRADFYPKNERDYFFRPIHDLASKDGYLYAVENFGHKVLKFSIDEELKFIKTIGQPGQGPGDLYLPIALSIWNGEFAVKDNISFSFFDTEGKFLRKFRAYSSKWSFVYVGDEIFWVNFNPEDMHLIEVYSKYGKKLFEFGEKFLKLDLSKFKGIGPFSVEQDVYQGDLLSDGEYLFYCNSTFGKIIKFNLEGRKVAETNVQSLFGDAGKETVEFNTEQWIEKGLVITPKKKGYFNYRIFFDAYLYKNKIYLLGASWTPTEPRGRMFIDIKAVDQDSFTLLEEYKLRKATDERALCFAVSEKAGEIIFFIFMRADEGDIIAEYREKK